MCVWCYQFQPALLRTICNPPQPLACGWRERPNASHTPPGALPQHHEGIRGIAPQLRTRLASQATVEQLQKANAMLHCLEQTFGCGVSSGWVVVGGELV